MYTQQELTDIRNQQKKRWLALAVPLLALLIALIFSLVYRSRSVTIAATLLAGVILIAGNDLLIRPLRCYERHLNNVLHGRLHDVKCTYTRIDDEISLVDGVAYRAMTFLTYDEKHKPYDLLFYLDAQKPVPEIPQGAQVRVTYHDHQIAALTVL